MRTEAAAQVYWTASLAWKRTPGFVEGITVEKLFRALDPIEFHRTPSISRQARDLSGMIVKGKIRRKAEKRRNNVVRLYPVLLETRQANVA